MTDVDPAPKPKPSLTLLEQRTIEAKIAGPLIRAFCERFGETEALPIVRNVITELAKTGGEALAEQIGNDNLISFAQGLERWKEAGALELVLIDSTAEQLNFNVTRCRYAEMYHSLGIADLGFILSCQRDFSLIEGFNPAIQLQRTQTLMQGAPFCDFRFQSAKSADLDPA